MFGFFKRIKYKCPDGTFRIVYRNVNDAIPLFIKGFDIKGGGDAKLMDQANFKLKAEYKDKIQGLLYNLDDRNNNLIFEFRNAYMVYQSHPCGKIDFFQEQVEKLNRDYHFRSTLKIQIDGLITLAEGNSNHDKIMEVYISILDKMGITNNFVAAYAIKENRDAAKKWIESNDG
jgi:hypothetical protein